PPPSAVRTAPPPAEAPLCTNVPTPTPTTSSTAAPVPRATLNPVERAIPATFAAPACGVDGDRCPAHRRAHSDRDRRLPRQVGRLTPGGRVHSCRPTSTGPGTSSIPKTA